MNRFLNRLPTITIREGHRVKVYLTSDLELPAYVAPGVPIVLTTGRTYVPSNSGIRPCVSSSCATHGARAVRRDRPGQSVQTMLIAERTAAALRRAARASTGPSCGWRRGSGNMDGYRIPTIPITRHDPSRWEYGRPWIQALNSGDATGAAYLSTALPLLRPTADAEPPDRQRAQALERQYATIEITDSVAMMGGHQVALARGYHGRLQNAVQALEGDVLNGLLRYHEMTAILDKIAAGELLGRRQDMAVEPAAVARPGAAAGAQQAAARHRGGHHEHAARDVARCGRPPTRRSSPAPATRSARGVSRRRTRLRDGGHDASSPLLARRLRRC